MIERSYHIATETAKQPTIANAIAIASGKGGVGKTWLSITLAHALVKIGRRVVLVDGDLGLANVDIQLGLAPEIDLGHVLDQDIALSTAAIRHETTGIDIVAGRSGVGSLASVPINRLMALGAGLARLAGTYDRTIIDLGAGIDRPVRYLAGMAGRALVITNDEPTSLTDAYALIKLLHHAGAGSGIGIAVNMATSKAEGERTYKTLAKACETFLGMVPPLWGVVRRDRRVRESIRSQSALLSRFPNSEAGEDVIMIAQQLAQSS